MNLPDDVLLNMLPTDTLTLSFTADCRLCCNDCNAFKDSNGKGLPNNKKFKAGDQWGPGRPRDREKLIVIFTIDVDKDCSDDKRISGGHIIHVGSSGSRGPFMKILAELYLRDHEFRRALPTIQDLLGTILKDKSLSLSPEVIDFVDVLLQTAKQLYELKLDDAEK
jgi:hypothetical protein